MLTKQEKLRACAAIRFHALELLRDVKTNFTSSKKLKDELRNEARLCMEVADKLERETDGSQANETS